MSYKRFEYRYLWAALPTLLLLAQFDLLMAVKRFKPLYWLYGVIFVVQDVAYNLIVGTWLFWEWPREWLFTTRLKRLDDKGHLPECINRFKNTLNEIDPGHV